MAGRLRVTESLSALLEKYGDPTRTDRDNQAWIRWCNEQCDKMMMDSMGYGTNISFRVQRDRERWINEIFFPPNGRVWRHDLTSLENKNLFHDLEVGYWNQRKSAVRKRQKRRLTRGELPVESTRECRGNEPDGLEHRALHNDPSDIVHPPDSDLPVPAQYRWSIRKHDCEGKPTGNLAHYTVSIPSSKVYDFQYLTTQIRSTRQFFLHSTEHISLFIKTPRENEVFWITNDEDLKAVFPGTDEGRASVTDGFKFVVVPCAVVNDRSYQTITNNINVSYPS